MATRFRRTLARRGPPRVDRFRRTVVRRILFGTLALAPLVIALHYFAHLSETTEFVLAAAALIPARLDHRRGDGARRGAHRPGHRRLPQRDLRQRARAHHRAHRGQRGAHRGRARLAHGSVVSNLLLVLGASLIAGGRGTLDRFSSFLSFGLLAVATSPLPDPAIPGWEGDPDREASRDHLGPGLDRAPRALCRRNLVLPPSALEDPRPERGRDERLVASLVTGRACHRDGRDSPRGRDPRRLGRGLRRPGGPERVLRRGRDHRDRRERSRARRRVVVAYRGKIALAAEIALASAAQVAVFLIPAVALLSWLIDPLALSFRPVEIAALAGAPCTRRCSCGAATRAARVATCFVWLRRRRGRVLRRGRSLKLSRSSCKDRLKPRFRPCGGRVLVVNGASSRDCRRVRVSQSQRPFHRRGRPRRRASSSGSRTTPGSSSARHPA